MADGGGKAQTEFFFTHVTAQSRLRPGEIVVDLFAGGGGASHALETALGRAVDIAINHNPWAVALHAANHPFTRHLCEDIWQANPRAETAGRRVGWLHASPDCTHFSQAKGGQPRSRATRALSWVVLRWAGTVRPRIISLENVEQILKWGPLVAKRDKDTGRVVKLDGSIAAPGERVPIDQQFLIPDRRREGSTWQHFVGALRALGYAVEWRKLKACDFGAGTSRTRLFMVARCDGEPIRWPAPTHGPGRARPYVTAADCIDWSIQGQSIFSRRRPLADATLRRVARGVKKFVIDAEEPFIVPGGVAPVLTEHANASGARCWSADEPLRTQCANVKGGHFALITAHLEQANGGFAADGAGHDVRVPMSTITGTGSQQRLVECVLSPEHEAGALRVAAFLVNYYGNGQALDLAEPLDTITTRDRLALVTVHVRGQPFVIVDIRLRMLQRHELFRAQGFPAAYIIDRTADGRAVTAVRSVAMVGNSVSPPPLCAIAAANLDPVIAPARMAA